MSIAAASPDRVQRQMEHWSRRSRRVATARKALPGAMVGLVLLLTGWGLARTLLPNLIAPTLDLANVRMTGLRFQGRDDRDRAFMIGADEAMVEGRGKDRKTTLIRPFMSLADVALLSASKGVYRQEDKVLELSGGVVFQDGRDSRLLADNARVDTKAGVVEGSGGTGVRVEGAVGAMTADSYAVYDSGRRIMLKGDVHARVYTE